MDTAKIIPYLMNLHHDDAFIGHLEVITNQLRALILEVGSETEDNLACTTHIEYGWVPSPWGGYSGTYGVKIRSKKVLLSEICNAVEGADIPQQVQELLPSLTQQDWDAAFRIVTLILLDLEIRQTMRDH